MSLLGSCCRPCHLNTCILHRLPELFVLAGQEAGCFPADALTKSTAPSLGDEGLNPVLLGAGPKSHPGHRLIYDGSYPTLMHLHHEGGNNVLMLSSVDAGDPRTAEDVLSWLEAIHSAWLP